MAELGQAQHRGAADLLVVEENAIATGGCLDLGEHIARRAAGALRRVVAVDVEHRVVIAAVDREVDRGGEIVLGRLQEQVLLFELLGETRLFVGEDSQPVAQLAGLLLIARLGRGKGFLGEPARLALGGEGALRRRELLLAHGAQLVLERRGACARVVVRALQGAAFGGRRIDAAAQLLALGMGALRGRLQARALRRHFRQRALMRVTLLRRGQALQFVAPRTASARSTRSPSSVASAS